MNQLLLAARKEVPLTAACQALGLSRATLYRHGRPKPEPKPRQKRRSPRQLSEEERQQVVEVLHQPQFVDQPPGEIVAKLLSEGVYLASVRTFYRILASLGENSERRALRTHPATQKPSVTATAPDQVWTWDITKLAGPVAGVFYFAYVIIDLYSRYVVGWLLAEKENAQLATQLIRDTIQLRGVEASQLVIHSDRGSPMTSGSMAQLCAKMGVTQSFSRPRVSNDNPFSESQFKTMKYQPDYPERFGSPMHSRGWLEEFFDWHNNGHHHAGLSMFTPGDVYEGRVLEIARRRQTALDAAYAAHPERFVKGPPVVRLPPESVSINPAIPLDIPSCEPPPEASLCPSPAQTRGGGVAGGVRDARRALASTPAGRAQSLTHPSTPALSGDRRAGPLAQKKGS